eukprot:gene5226-biopygen1936
MIGVGGPGPGRPREGPPRHQLARHLVERPHLVLRPVRDEQQVSPGVASPDGHAGGDLRGDGPAIGADRGGVVVRPVGHAAPVAPEAVAPVIAIVPTVVRLGLPLRRIRPAGVSLATVRAPAAGTAPLCGSGPATAGEVVFANAGGREVESDDEGEVLAAGVCARACEVQAAHGTEWLTLGNLAARNHTFGAKTLFQTQLF